MNIKYVYITRNFVSNGPHSMFNQNHPSSSCDHLLTGLNQIFKDDCCVETAVRSWLISLMYHKIKKKSRIPR